MNAQYTLLTLLPKPTPCQRGGRKQFHIAACLLLRRPWLTSLESSSEMSTASTVCACVPSSTAAMMSAVVCIVQVSSRYCHHYLSTGMACFQVLMSSPAVHTSHATHSLQQIRKGTMQQLRGNLHAIKSTTAIGKQGAFAEYCKKEPQRCLLLEGLHCQCRHANTAVQMHTAGISRTQLPPREKS